MPHVAEQILEAPPVLGLDERVAFRDAAVAALDALPPASGRLVIDLVATHAVDSAGLGALIVVQRHAAERRQSICLRHMTDELRFLLVLTKLADLFDVEG